MGIHLLLHPDQQLPSPHHHLSILLLSTRSLHHTHLFTNQQSCSPHSLFLPLSWPRFRPFSLRARDPALALTSTSLSLADGTRTVRHSTIHSGCMRQSANTLSQTPAVKATSLPASAPFCPARAVTTRMSHTTPTRPITAPPSPLARFLPCNKSMRTTPSAQTLPSS